MGFNKYFFLITILAVVSCQDKNSIDSISKYDKNTKQLPAVIYGDDNRLDLYAAPTMWQERALSTVALLRNSSLSDMGNGFYSLNGENYGSSYNLCEEEPFREQTKAAFCSGFLVAPDKIATAGHCIRTSSDCKKTKFVFGFAIAQKGLEPTQFASSEVYSCKEIIKSTEESTGADFSVVSLDRTVSNHPPLPLQNFVSNSGNPLLVIGHPAGIPVKISGGALVRSVNPKFYVANLDTYGGNSGSAVFNESTGEVVGILVRGETDFVYKNNCRVSNHCPDTGCRGEDVTRIDQVLPFLSNML